MAAVPVWADLTAEQRHAFESIPISPPPAGLTTNFVNPPNLAGLTLSVPSILLAIALLFFVNRLYTKAKLSKDWTWDDATVSLAMAVAIAQYVLTIYGLQKGIIGRHAWDTPIASVLCPAGQHYLQAIFILQPIMLLFLKASFFILYLRLFYSNCWARISSWIGLVAVILSHGGLAIACMVAIGIRDPLRFQRYSSTVGIILGSFGLVLDLVIFVVPYLVVASLQMSRAKKIGVYLTFLTGGIAIIFSILNIYFRTILRHSQDPLWDEVPLTLAAFAEIFLGITCACVPALIHGFRHPNSLYAKAIRYSSRTGSSRSANPSAPQKSSKSCNLDTDLDLLSRVSESNIYTTVEVQVTLSDAHSAMSDPA